MFVAMATVKFLSLRGGTAHAHSEIRIAHALMASKDPSIVGPERRIIYYNYVRASEFRLSWQN